VNDAIEDGVGERRVADDLVPSVDRELPGNEDGACVVAVLDDLQEVAALVGVELLRPPSSSTRRSTRESVRRSLA
jgi:hypothetical protein